MGIIQCKPGREEELGLPAEHLAHFTMTVNCVKF